MTKTAAEKTLDELKRLKVYVGGGQTVSIVTDPIAENLRKKYVEVLERRLVHENWLFLSEISKLCSNQAKIPPDEMQKQLASIVDKFIPNNANVEDDAADLNFKSKEDTKINVQDKIADPLIKKRNEGKLSIDDFNPAIRVVCAISLGQGNVDLEDEQKHFAEAFEKDQTAFKKKEVQRAAMFFSQKHALGSKGTTGIRPGDDRQRVLATGKGWSGERFAEEEKIKKKEKEINDILDNVSITIQGHEFKLLSDGITPPNAFQKQITAIYHKTLAPENLSFLQEIRELMAKKASKVPMNEAKEVDRLMKKYFENDSPFQVNIYDKSHLANLKKDMAEQKTLLNFAPLVRLASPLVANHMAGIPEKQREPLYQSLLQAHKTDLEFQLTDMTLRMLQEVDQYKEKGEKAGNEKTRVSQRALTLVSISYQQAEKMSHDLKDLLNDLNKKPLTELKDRFQKIMDDYARSQKMVYDKVESSLPAKDPKVNDIKLLVDKITEAKTKSSGWMKAVDDFKTQLESLASPPGRPSATASLSKRR